MPDPRHPDDASRERTRQRPAGRPVQFQTWKDLLFLHWRFPTSVIQATLPPGLTVDTFDGDAWVGIVPFRMRNIRPRGLPSVPFISNFLELNLRTYAYNEQGVPGVWFYTLEANRLLAVLVARKFFHLPYRWCSMVANGTGQDGIDYKSRRRRGPDRRICHFEYRQSGPVEEATFGSLEWFLLERYVLFAPQSGPGRTSIGRVHHHPYPFAAAEVPQWDTHLIEFMGLPSPERAPDHVAYSPGVDVEIFALER